MEAYRLALTEGTVSAPVPRCLLQLGLLRSLPDAPTTYVPVPPDVALFDMARPIERAILNQQHMLASMRVSVSRLETVYQEVQQQSAPVRLLLGESAISAALEKAVGSCRRELLTAQPGGGRDPELLAEAIDRDLALSARGVRQRTLYQHTVRSHGPTLAYIERITAAGAQVRTVDEIIDRLIVCDRSIAFIPGVQQRRTAALVIQDPGVIQYLLKYFEYLWEAAKPVRGQGVTAGGGAEALTHETRRSVLELMVRGHTDEAIAARLGISARTVSTHVKKAADLLGSRSRAQLGYLLARTGLLDDPEALEALGPAAQAPRRGVDRPEPR
ncbi:LuxR C-terminal-related transcriptional regulator [Streptomyces albireticuli]|uniref:LuxR C-terminal-related transcriptional regulator n=1 Tax=Streptomyces albireticuli TaxID=1940 RepID=UPI001E412FBE|nr:LuxR C-terminal-related transcriptional regulator [Streptomyces albireticuli]MCD9145095.1 LuxR C-terminal-related transcriptional regulator [Streptomyces albireticuli]MCD9164730.1 LuxR C-terminal-related transcriptional regulator [Streptomyces albireticuli]MCD9194995.1 LuxR C-terminal-related transcriptional regulator [Streptomyces albireticuli]